MSLRNFVVLEEHETVELMRQSSKYGAVHMSFGPGWVGIRKGEHPWAEALVRQWRGQDYAEGGGI